MTKPIPSIRKYMTTLPHSIGEDQTMATAHRISIHLDKGQLTIEAVRADDAPSRALITEYRPCDYLRIFSIPAGIDASKIDAQLASGVLRLHLP